MIELIVLMVILALVSWAIADLDKKKND